MPASTNSNFINDPADGKLLYLKTASTIGVWEDAAASQAIVITTKDIDFGDPGIKKTIYKVIISYKGDGSALNVYYDVNGDTTLNNQFNSDATPLISSGTTDWQTAELIPTTVATAKDIYSFQLKISGTPAADFEINDISIIYRMKGVR